MYKIPVPQIVGNAAKVANFNGEAVRAINLNYLIYIFHIAFLNAMISFAALFKFFSLSAREIA